MNIISYIYEHNNGDDIWVGNEATVTMSLEYNEAIPTVVKTPRYEVRLYNELETISFATTRQIKMIGKIAKVF